MAPIRTNQAYGTGVLSAKKPEKKKRILGTADYMAPEVIKGEDTNYLLDFWSLGIIGYEFLTGNLPFNDDSP